MTQYYIADKGVQTGPFTLEELKYHNLTPHTLVWREGLPQWVEASTQSELQPYITKQTPPPLGEQGGVPTPHTNWMPWAIVTTVLGVCTGCITLVLGIIAIIQANKANDFYMRHMDEMAEAANSNAKILTIIGLVLGGVSLLATIALLATGNLVNVIQQLAEIQ